MRRNCFCMLCQSNGLTPSKAQLLQDVRFKQAPTILCRYIDFWREMHNLCCCQTHERCDFNLVQHCGCPKCCPCQLTVNACDNCKTMNVNYFPCYHQRGVCKSYLREKLPGEEKEVPMEIDWMDIHEMEYYFALCCTCLCFLQSMYMCLYYVEKKTTKCIPFKNVYAVNRHVIVCMEYLIAINNLVMIWFSFVMLAVYLSKVLNYCSQYIPLSSLYLLWKLDNPEYRAWHPF